MSDKVSPETVRHVAELARIDLTDDELQRHADEFATILDHFETLDDVPAVDESAELVNVLRPDEADAGLDRADALENAAETEDDFFTGPPVS